MKKNLWKHESSFDDSDSLYRHSTLFSSLSKVFEFSKIDWKILLGKRKLGLCNILHGGEMKVIFSANLVEWSSQSKISPRKLRAKPDVRRLVVGWCQFHMPISLGAKNSNWNGPISWRPDFNDLFSYRANNASFRCHLDRFQNSMNIMPHFLYSLVGL